MQLLLDHKADPAVANEEGWQPLHLAARAGRQDKVTALLAAGAPLGAANQQGNTPLHLVRNPAPVFRRGRAQRRLAQRGRGVLGCCSALGMHAAQCISNSPPFHSPTMRVHATHPK